MWKLGLATAFGGLVGGVPMNATSAMTDLNKEGGLVEELSICCLS